MCVETSVDAEIKGLLKEEKAEVEMLWVSSMFRGNLCLPLEIKKALLVKETEINQPLLLMVMFLFSLFQDHGEVSL